MVISVVGIVPLYFQPLLAINQVYDVTQLVLGKFCRVNVLVSISPQRIVDGPDSVGNNLCSLISFQLPGKVFIHSFIALTFKV